MQEEFVFPNLVGSPPLGKLLQVLYIAITWSQLCAG